MSASEAKALKGIELEAGHLSSGSLPRIVRKARLERSQAYGVPVMVGAVAAPSVAPELAGAAAGAAIGPASSG
jgi:hypothetical protein